ncbi:jg21125 [Pararge aegeria aegeria]|uniref:Jg21125 protein n=1 Tax=Pararge aegeria aegeria TaxID=348720 RepID=A0A8S4RNT8_9NEOP|nr:jg21125 [Pararge aegeria aegeria]
MGGAHSSEEGWTLGSQGAGMTAALVNAALVDPRRGGGTTLGASQVAAGFKLHKTVEYGTPYKRPMSSSGRLSVDMIMITFADVKQTNICFLTNILTRSPYIIS